MARRRSNGFARDCSSSFTSATIASCACAWPAATIASPRCQPASVRRALRAAIHSSCRGGCGRAWRCQLHRTTSPRVSCRRAARGKHHAFDPDCTGRWRFTACDHLCGRRRSHREDADQAPCGDLPGESLVRRVLRDVSGSRSTRPASPHFTRGRGTPSVNGLTPTLIERNPNSSKPFRIDRIAVVHLRPGPRVHGRAEGAQWRPHGPVRALRRAAADQRPPVLPQVGGGRVGHGDGLLRRQHRHRALELRAALRAQRQQLRDHERTSRRAAR